MSPYQRSDCALTIIVGAIFFAMAVWIIAVSETVSEGLIIVWFFSVFLLGVCSLGMLPFLYPLLLLFALLDGEEDLGTHIFLFIFGGYPLLSSIAMFVFDVQVWE